MNEAQPVANPYLEASTLEIWRGMNRLCRNLGFSLRGGEILHIEGPNGCGKTSLLRVLAGLALPEAGEVRWGGQPIRRDRYGYQQDLAWLGHQDGLKGALTPLENLRFMARLSPRSERLDPGIMLRELGIGHLQDLPCRHLSAGQKRRVALARVLLSPARIWLLDEPYTSLDTASIMHLNRLFADHLGEGGLIVLSSHQAVSLPGIAPRILQMPGGMH